MDELVEKIRKLEKKFKYKQLILDALLKEVSDSEDNEWRLVKDRDEKYKRFYKSRRWSIARWYIAYTQDYKCKRCGKFFGSKFQLHHLSEGKDYFDLKVDCLECKCIPCHEEGHAIPIREALKTLSKERETKMNTKKEKAENFFKNDARGIKLVGEKITGKPRPNVTAIHKEFIGNLTETEKKELYYLLECSTFHKSLYTVGLQKVTIGRKRKKSGDNFNDEKKKDAKALKDPNLEKMARDRAEKMRKEIEKRAFELLEEEENND